MFTGFINNLGKIKNIKSVNNLYSCEIIAPIIDEFSIGSSVAINGICLTVTYLTKDSFIVDMTSETVKRINFADFQIGKHLNIELPMKASDRFEGHFLLGHIDTTGKITKITKNKGSNILEVTYPVSYKNLVVDKGSIGIDGISLTIINPTHNSLAVTIIPHTFENTNLKYKNIGNKVNLEFDIILKGIQKKEEYGQKKRTFLY